MLHEHHAGMLAAADARAGDAAAAAREAAEAAAARQLAFIDRLLADKDELASKCRELADVVR
eukprot:333326-Chlamydomonas_euryale.AAC.1